MKAADIRVSIGGSRILDGVSLSVGPGMLLGLLGPNGAGKTTLLEVLAGLRGPQTGTVSWAGRPVAARDGAARARAIGYLEQGSRSHWPVAVEHVVGLGRLPHLGPWARPGPADAAAVERALLACDVAALRRRDVTTLSGGERARVMLARVLAGEPQVLLADEPVAGLDPHHQIRCMELLAARAAAGMAVVVVLHDLALALRFCDRICLLAAGRVAADGTPAQLLATDAIEKAYGIGLVKAARDGRPYALPWSLHPEERSPL